MRILHIGKYYPPARGGMEGFLRDLAREQRSRGAEVAVLAHDHRPSLPWGRARSETDQGVEAVRVPILGRAAHVPVAPTFPRVLGRMLRRFRPDIIHAHLPNASCFWLLGRACSALPPLVLQWQADVPKSLLAPPLSPLLRLHAGLEAKLLQRAGAVAAGSEYYLESSPVLARFRDKCRVVPLAVSPARLASPDPAEVERIRNSLKGKGLVLALGRFTFYKGFLELIRAAAMVPDAIFIIIGRGPVHKAARREVERLRLEHRVLLPGGLSDREVANHMEACDLFCLPSLDRCESFGLVLLEAMAHAKPLLTTAIPGSGVNLVNIPGQTGLSVPPGDPKELARAANQLLADPETAARMGMAGRERLKREFLIANCAEKMERLYEELLSGRVAGKAA